MSDNEKINLCNIINNYLQKDWSKSNILKNIFGNYYVTSPGKPFKEKHMALTKINEDEWGSIVNKGIQQYGKFCCNY